MDKVQKLTWNRTTALTLLVLLGSMVVGILLRRFGVFLSPPLFGLTPYLYYLLIGAAPAFITLLLCARAGPTGSRLLLFLSPFLCAFIFLFYLLIINPSLYPTIECREATSSGLFVHSECSCDINSSDGPIACSTDRLMFTPFMLLHEDR